jgi:tetratricopeptide (TPR) repeat protein
MHYIRLLTIYQPSLIILSAVAIPGSGEVLELADRRDLGSRAARRTGSTPVFPTAISGMSYSPDKCGFDTQIPKDGHRGKSKSNPSQGCHIFSGINEGMSKRKRKYKAKLAQSAAALRGNGLKDLQKGDYDGAIGTWERIPPDFRPSSALAEAYFRRGLERVYGTSPDPEAGLSDLERALAYQPGDPGYAFHLGLAAYRSGDLEPAIRNFRIARKGNSPFAARAAYPLAVALLQKGEDPASDPVWGSLNAGEQDRLRSASGFRHRPYNMLPDAPELWRALAAVDAGEHTQARDGLSRAMMTAGKQREKALAHYYLGVVAAREENLETARKEWTAAYAAGLRTPRLENNLAEIYHRLAEESLQNDDPQTALAVAKESARLKEADKSLNELISQAQQQLGYQAAGSGDWEAAQSHWRSAVEANEPSFRLAYNLAMAYEQNGNNLAAAESWREALRRRPRRADHPDALSDGQVARLWQRAAEAYRRAGDYEEATGVYQQAIKWNPDNVDVRLALSEALLWEGRVQAAQNELDRILERDPENIPALVRMGEVLFRSEQWWVRTGAPQYWERVLQLQPDNAEARQGLADYYRDQAEIDYSWDRFLDAVEDYQKALEYQPEDAWTLAAIANCYIQAGDEQTAGPYIDRAIQRAPTDLDVYYEIIGAWIQVNKPEQAERLVKRAEAKVETIPAEFYVNCAGVCFEAGQDAQAAAWLESAIAQSPPDVPLLVLIGEMAMNYNEQLAQRYLEQAVSAGQLPGQAHLMLGILADRRDEHKIRDQHWREAERIARQTKDPELADRVEFARILAAGPGTFLEMLMERGGPDAVEDFLSSFIGGEFDDE